MLIEHSLIGDYKNASIQVDIVMKYRRQVDLNLFGIEEPAHTSAVSWPLSIVNMIVVRSTAMNFASIAPVLRTFVHFIAVSVTISWQKTRASNHYKFVPFS